MTQRRNRSSVFLEAANVNRGLAQIMDGGIHPIQPIVAMPTVLMFCEQSRIYKLWVVPLVVVNAHISLDDHRRDPTKKIT